MNAAHINQKIFTNIRLIMAPSCWEFDAIK